MLNSLRDGQINYGTTNCPSVHVPPHNVVAPIHQNSLISTEPSTPVYQWNANHRLEHLYGFHSRYYNLDFPTPYPPTTNQYVPTNVYGQNLPQCCQPCCQLRSQNIPKASPPQVLYNPRPVQQLNRSYKSKKTLKTPCSEQFLPYIPNDLPVKYDTQNCYQQKYSSSYLNNTNYCPPANNLWNPPAANPTWSTDRLRPNGYHTNVVSHDFSREKNHQRLSNYQSNPYSKPTSATHHIPYNYIPPIPDVPPIYHNPLKNNTAEYVSHDHSSRLPISSQNIQNPSSIQQYYNTQPVPYSDVHIPSGSFKQPQITPKNTSKNNLNVREFLATWDEGEEEIGEKSSETAEPIVVLDCMTLDEDALTKIQEKLNVVSYENLEKVLKENQNPLVISTEPNEINSSNNKLKLPSKPNFEPLDYTKRETGIIKPFITEKKTLPETNSQSEKSYSVNFDGMVAWYGKKNTDISSTDLIERLADRIFNLSKSQENEGVSFGTAAYTGQITQTDRSIETSDQNTSKYIQSPQMFDLQHHANKCIEPPLVNKINCNKDSTPRVHSFVLNESNKASNIKSNNVNSSCIVENITKKCLNVTNEETTPWHLDQSAQEQHLNTSLYDHSVVMKPLDFSSLTDGTKENSFVFEKMTSSDKPNDSINNQCNKVFNVNNNYSSTISNSQHSIQQIDSSNRNFPVIVSPHRQEYNGFHESVIQRTGCDRNRHDKVTTQTDFESINWNISNDLDKIMKNTNMVMEPSCLYDRNNYSILDGMNPDKNVSTRWKDNVPCVDLTINSKTNAHHDSFFDGWSFIESYENHSSKKISNTVSNDNTHHPLFPNQMTSLEESTKNNNNCCEKNDTETLAVIKSMPPYLKTNNLSPTNRQSRDVFNLNNRIPDFSDGFELPIINEPHGYLEFKKYDNEHRTDGSIFEHLNEPKCITTLNETLNYKNDQNNKHDFVGLPSFKEKEPLAPVSAPSKLNIVKPTLRDPSQIYTVIKQKLKYDNSCIDNDSVISNKTENNLKEHLTNTLNATDLKSKYNSVQLNQFDVWSEKFVLKGNSNRSSSAVVQCDVEITQFKSTPENRNTLPKSNMNENYQEKITMLSENTNCNSAASKINIIESNKINSNDFLNCLESTKTDDQKYGDTFDEFETSFGFDIHCNNESNKSFHENNVDKCFEESIKDQIVDHTNTVESITNMSNNTSSSNNTELPFQCNFQSSYLIKNYFDENKDKTVVLGQKQINNHDKSDTTVFKYHGENLQEFELQNNEDINIVKSSEKNSGFNMDCDVGQIQNDNHNNNTNYINEVKSYESKHEKNNDICKVLSGKKNNFDYLNTEDRHFGFENKKSIIGSTISNETTVINNSVEPNSIRQIHNIALSTHKLIHFRKNSNVLLNTTNTNIFEPNSKSTSIVSPIETNKNHEPESNKNNFKSNSDGAEKDKHNIDTKNIFKLDNNNSDMYHTHNLEKIDEFDFDTRIIHNLEIECSNVNAKKPTDLNEIFTNNSQMKTNCGFEINDTKKKVKQDTNYKDTLVIQDELRVEETLDLNCHSDTPPHNVIETENVNQKTKIDRIFEISCISNNVQEKLNLENPKIQTDFDIQNKITEKMNVNNCNTREISNRSNNLEVESIFENIYDSLSTLNTVNNDTNISKNCCQNNINCDVSKSLEITEDLNKNKNSDAVDKVCEETNMDVFRDTSNETFEETDNVLLQEFVNDSADRLTAVSMQQNSSMKDDKSKPTLIEYSTDALNKNVTNVNENPSMSLNQHTEDIKENEKNGQPINNLTVNTVQSDATLAIFETLNSGLLDALQTTYEKEHSQNNGFESSAFYSVGFTSQQSSNAVEGSTNSEPCTLSHVEMTNHQNFNQLTEVNNSVNHEPNLLNHDESISQQHSVKTAKTVDTSSGPSSLNHDEVISQQPVDEMLKSEDVTSPKFISINHDVSTPQRNPNKIDEIEDSISRGLGSSRPTELSKQNSNEFNGVDDSINHVPSLLNHDELTFHQYSKEMVEVEDSTSSLKHDELEYHQNLNEINEVEDLTISGPSSINQDESESQQSVNEIYKFKNLTSFGPSSINQNELEFHQNSNSTDEVEDLTRSGPSSINQDKFDFQHNSNTIYESVDLTSSGPNSIDQDELEFHQNTNATDEAEDLTRSGPSSINQNELEFHQKSNATDEAEDLTSSINQDELEFQLKSNKMYEAEDCTRSGPISINQDELEFQTNTTDTDKAEDLTSSGPSSINQNELEFQQNADKTDEAVDLTISRPSLLKRVVYKSRQNLNKSVEEDLISPVGSLLNHNNELICQEMFVEPCSTKNSAISKHDIPEPNYHSCIKNKDFKGIADNVQLPRVKFILKCHSRNMIKKNIFDEESTVPYKKRNACYKQYTPWRSMFKKESIVEPNGRYIKESIETTTIPQTIINLDIAQDVQTLGEEKKNDDKFVSLPDRMFDRDGDRDDVLKTSSGNEGDGIDGGYEPLNTPIPSPFDDFQSENPTPEHCGGEVYWDKSLEDEYKNVLHKTISKLAKVRANARDKFNSRLLARRVNETKRRKRQWRRRRRRLLVADKAAVVIIRRVDDPVEPVVAAVKVSTSPVCKIKVQLPWGRIFNMNGPEGDRNKTKDTKIEMGPAKVEVRLSRTPSEWQVAACRSMTSSKSVVVVKRLVLQRATNPAVSCGDNDDYHHHHRHSHSHDDSDGTDDNRPNELSRKLPKIVIRRNGQDNNYTSYVSSSGFENSGGDEHGDGGDNDKDDGDGGVPQLMVRLVRDRKLDAMAVEGVTTLNLKHLVPISESEVDAAMEADMHCAKRVRYS